MDPWPDANKAIGYSTDIKAIFYVGSNWVTGADTKLNRVDMDRVFVHVRFYPRCLSQVLRR